MCIFIFVMWITEQTDSLESIIRETENAGWLTKRNQLMRDINSEVEVHWLWSSCFTKNIQLIRVIHSGVRSAVLCCTYLLYSLKGIKEAYNFQKLCISQREFWFLAAVASGLLSWGHLISSDYRQLDFTDTI